MTGRLLYLLMGATIFTTGIAIIAIRVVQNEFALLFIMFVMPLISLFLIIRDAIVPEKKPDPVPIPINEICAAAMRRVNNNPLFSDFVVTDIGLILHKSANQQPMVIRNTTIPKSTRYLRPFAGLEARAIDYPVQTIALEICEERGRVLYRYEAIDGFQDKTLILPNTWLDVTTAENDLSDKNWSIRVYVDGKLLALHLVYWSKFDESDVQKEHRRDGEISAQLRRLMEQERVSTNISLDDLLADQHE